MLARVAVAKTLTGTNALAVLNWSHTFWPYACGMFLFTFMANFNCTPFNSILPEIVPQGQRATSVAIGGSVSN